MKTALITGITGQDGSYMAELLLEKGYEVHGVIRRSSSFNTGRIEHILHELHNHYGDITDGGSISRLINQIAPDEIYNFAAQSHVKVSEELPDYTCHSDGAAIVAMLEAIKGTSTKFYQASTSEMFGNIKSDGMISLADKMHPCSVYGASKLLAHNLCTTYRNMYGLDIKCGVLFNHESERRGETFVTRKITRAATRIKAKLQSKLYLGNLDSIRDFGYAPDYVEGIYEFMQSDLKEVILATGRGYSVADFLTFAFTIAGLEWENYVIIDDRYKRKNDIGYLVGDPRMAHSCLGWRAKKDILGLVETMIEHDMRLAHQEAKK